MSFNYSNQRTYQAIFSDNIAYRYFKNLLYKLKAANAAFNHNYNYLICQMRGRFILETLHCVQNDKDLALLHLNKLFVVDIFLV